MTGVAQLPVAGLSDAMGQHESVIMISFRGVHTVMRLINLLIEKINLPIMKRGNSFNFY